MTTPKPIAAATIPGGVKTPAISQLTADKKIVVDPPRAGSASSPDVGRLRTRALADAPSKPPVVQRDAGPKAPALRKVLPNNPAGGGATVKSLPNNPAGGGATVKSLPKLDNTAPGRADVKTLPPPVTRSTQGGSPKTLDLGKRPDVLRKPDGLKLPDAAKTPGVVGKPDFVSKPNLAGKSDFTGKPDFTRKPELSGPPQRVFGSGPANGRTLEAKDAAKLRFADRYKAGDFDRLAKGETANKLRLAEQYKLHQQGDVARRLDLYKGGNKFVGVNNVHVASKVLGPSYRYLHGPVHPHFADDSFKHAYWGHHWFGATSWYPHWRPWVTWSWHFHCNPFWDPRPYWCRPIYYDPCPTWIYWSTPAFVSLPVVASGTWVDVERPVLPAEQIDLQLLAVRFVDPGHPEEKLGPRYRVWFRNNGEQPVTQAFNVILFAANDNRLVAGLPQAGVRVTSVEAGETQSVDIRLPADVYAMGRDAAGNPAPFATLHALVDANREVADVARTNNGAPIARGEILPVDPAGFEADPQQAAAGGEIVLAGEGFGPQPGRVLVNVAGQEHDAEILGWYDLGVRLNLPKLTLTAATAADVVVVRGDGAAANPVRVTITP